MRPTRWAGWTAVDALDQQRPHGDRRRRRNHSDEPRSVAARRHPFEAGGLVGEIVGGGQGELALLGHPQQDVAPGNGQVIVCQALEVQGLECLRRHIGEAR